MSSTYDAFVLEEDGSLSDRLFYEYSELSLSWAPRITHAPTADRSLELIRQRRFDLVITVPRVGDMDAADLSWSIKAQQSDLPVVLLIFDEADLRTFADGRAPDTVDHVFLWEGDAAVLIATIKCVEDQQNVDHDTTTAGVQVILVAEDSPRAYSSFLGLLYPEMLRQASSLIAEGLNDYHRLMRMRARPKIVLATDFEHAAAQYRKYERSVCALMSDLRLPRGGRLAPEHGIELATLMRRSRPDLPVLFESSEPDGEARADAANAWFINKDAPNFRAKVRAFLQEALGFGDFVFRLPNRTEVGRASDVFEMESLLHKVPLESVAYHASRHHFSTWLRARSMFQVANHIRPRHLSDYRDVEALRAELVDVLRVARVHEQEGVITDLASRHTGPENRFVRVGRGSIGGKGRSIAFVSTEIVRHNLLDQFEGLQVRIPKTVVLGTDTFDEVMADIPLTELLDGQSDTAITERFLASPLPGRALRDLRTSLASLQGPLAVRSSSLLEDSRFQPFAGVYATYMLPNSHPDEEVRLQQVVRAIKAVYASAFWREARSYLAGTPNDLDDQKMAVVIQQLVGRRFGDRFYPPISGVAQSYNDYPVGNQQPEEGVAHIALGLGHTVVSGGASLRFSPASPTVLPQYPTAEAFLRGSQSAFYALDLSRAEIDLLGGPESSLVCCSLSDAEQDGTLALVGSVYSAADDVIRENLSLPGPRVVTFSNVLRWESMPLAEALLFVLTRLREAVGEEVEVEFAVDVPAVGQDGPPSGVASGPRLYLLQTRPMSTPEHRHLGLDLSSVADVHVLCRTDVASGHGIDEQIRDIVYVSREQLDSREGRRIIDRVTHINAALQREHRPYALIGPGRWGSSDPSLGVGVRWGDICGAGVIIETPIGERRIEPSQGTHFFRNITAARIGYLTVEQRADSELDVDWIEGGAGGARAVSTEDGVSHFQLEEPLGVYLDGKSGTAVVLKRPHRAYDDRNA